MTDNINKKLDLIVNACEEKIGKDIVKLEMDPELAITDYLVIATGNTPNQTRAIVDEIEKECEENSIEIMGKEGYREGNWILLDLSDIIVHVFTPDARDYYDLERLWSF